MANLEDVVADERALVAYALRSMDDFTLTRSKQSYERAHSALERAETLRREAERLRRPRGALAHRASQGMHVDHAHLVRAQPLGEARGVAIDRGGVERKELVRPRHLDHVGAFGCVPHDVASRCRARDVAHMPVHAAAEKRSDV